MFSRQQSSLLQRRPADVADKLLGRTTGWIGFLSHLRPLAATMSQKSSVPQLDSFVSQVLKQNIRPDARPPARRRSPASE
jgi:hypothetical protein